MNKKCIGIYYLRSLIFERMKPGHFSAVDPVGQFFLVFDEPVLTHADILAGGLDAEVLANGRPEFVFPRDEVIFNTEKNKQLSL